MSRPLPRLPMISMTATTPAGVEMVLRGEYYPGCGQTQETPSEPSEVDIQETLVDGVEVIDSLHLFNGDAELQSAWFEARAAEMLKAHEDRRAAAWEALSPRGL